MNTEEYEKQLKLKDELFNAREKWLGRSLNTFYFLLIIPYLFCIMLVLYYSVKHALLVNRLASAALADPELRKIEW